MFGFDFQTIEKNVGNDALDLELLSDKSGGFISANKNIFQHLLPLSDNSRKILEESIKGTPLIKLGNSYPRIMVVAGIHGNELAPQIASLILIDKLFNLNLKGTVYIIPFACPNASMNNSRFFNNTDLNRTAHISDSISNIIIKKAKSLKVSAIGDFHSTTPNSNPGREGVFCTRNPTVESFHIANFISKTAGSEIITYPKAGIPFKGALEDESNLLGIPAVTCEVLSAIGYANKRICQRSLIQMKSFLQFFGLFDNYII